VQLVDLSHTVEDGMVTYRGIPAPVISDYLSREASRGRYAPGTEFHIGKIEMAGNTGTYVDSPFHRFPDGGDLADLRLEQLALLEALLVRAPVASGRVVDQAAFAQRDVRGKAVLVHTGWDRHWRTEHYFEGHPFLTEAAARYLADAGATLVGIDSLNIDDPTDPHSPSAPRPTRRGHPDHRTPHQSQGRSRRGRTFDRAPRANQRHGLLPSASRRRTARIAVYRTCRWLHFGGQGRASAASRARAAMATRSRCAPQRPSGPPYPPGQESAQPASPSNRRLLVMRTWTFPR